MRRNFPFMAFVTSLAAAILLVGCGSTVYTYTGPVLTDPSNGTVNCSGCFISGTFTIAQPFPFGSLLTTYPDIRALSNSTLKSFDFTISGFPGTPPDWSSSNGATVHAFGVSLDSSGNLGNWNINISGGGTGFATCNATAAFETEFPATATTPAGFPPGSACDEGPIDIFFGTGGFSTYSFKPGSWTAK